MNPKQFYLLAKRLYKKPSFLFIILLIPLIVLAVRSAGEDESGFVRVALADESSSALADKIISELSLSENDIILFREYSGHDEALEAVKTGAADAAWIFPEGLEEKLSLYTKNFMRSEPFVILYERETNIVLRLLREKLSGVLYRYSSGTMYLNYVRDNIPELNELSDEELWKYYYSFDNGVGLFDFHTSDSKSPEEESYITAPVRGLLGVVIALGGLAGAMFYLEDEKRGVFLHVPRRSKMLFEFMSVFLCAGSIGLFCLIALVVSGLYTNIGREAFLMAIYAVNSTLFALVVKEIARSVKVTAILCPFIACAMTAVCPVFFDLNVFHGIKNIFPLTWYLKAVHNNGYIDLFVLWGVVTAVLLALLKLLKKKIRG